MTEVRRIQCDGCGQESEEKEPRNWLVMDIGVIGNPTKSVVHTCSWDCLGRYATRRARENQTS